MRSSTGATQVLPRRDETFLHNPSLAKKIFFCRRVAVVRPSYDALSARSGPPWPAVDALGESRLVGRFARLIGASRLQWVHARPGRLAPLAPSVPVDALGVSRVVRAVAAPCRVASAVTDATAPRSAPRGGCCRTVRKFGFEATSSYSILN